MASFCVGFTGSMIFGVVVLRLEPVLKGSEYSLESQALELLLVYSLEGHLRV